MSSIGRKPVSIPEGVSVDVAPGRVQVNGPKGELTQELSQEMDVSLDDGVLTVARPTDRAPHRALHGLTRSLIANMVEGVTDGFSKELEIQGVGYRARLQGKSLELSVGYSHTVSIPAPGRHRVRGSAANSGHRSRHRQAARGRDRRPYPPRAPARALQGQGHPLLRRVRPQEGR